MAEGLGLAASIIAVLQITTQVASLSYKYLSGVNRAPQELQKFTYELKSLITILSTLQVCAQDPQSTALREVEGPLRECHAGMMKLQDKLKLKKGLWSRLKWPLEEKEGLEYLARIERFKSLFTLALDADQLARTKLIAEDVQQIKAEIRNVSTAQELDKQREEAEKRRKALDWLYPEPPEKRHIEVSGQRRKNTGQWIFQTSEVQAWIQGNPNRRLLWGYGIPGAGKTFISSLVIDHIEEQALAANYGVAYIYFSYQEQAQQTPINTLSSIVKQLASRKQRLPKKIEDVYDTNKRPTLEQLYSALLDITSSFTQTFVICDALDECNQGSQRKELLPLFHRMGKATTGINLFLTSREHPEDIQHSFKDIAKIRLWAKDDDIATYIEQKIAENPRAERLVGLGKCKDRIISDLKECANGMFLLVRFHIENLCQQTTVRQILAELERLKSSSNEEHPMDPTYSRAMEILRMQPKNCIELAFKILSWLVKARRILTVRELQLAVSVEQDRTTFDELDLPDRKTLLDVCASLVTIDEIGDTVRLIHYTTQEFLVRNKLIPGDADFQLAMACTTFISYDIFAHDIFAHDICSYDEMAANYEKMVIYPFIGYAAQELHFHLKACNEALTKDIVCRFLQKERSIHSYMHAKEHYNFGRFSIRLIDTPLYIAATLGHSLVVEYLLKQSRKYINTRSDEDGGMTPLLSAASRGHEFVVKLLLENGADISVIDKYGRTALYQAASLGHEEVVRLLLKNGADVSVAHRDGRKLLYRAASLGHEAVVQLLLENGADISVADKCGYTALSRAASSGHEAVVRLLLENGADVSVAGNDGYTALSRAASSGHEAVVRLLLENGADVSVADNNGDTALSQAASSGHEAVVQLLLENGADVSVVNEDSWMVLSLAAYSGHEAVVRLLLENGADVSVADKYGRTALSQAASSGNEAVVRLLLENGADVSVADKDGKTTLFQAASLGHEAVVRLLLENGADILVVDEDGETALSRAAYLGHEAVVRLLLENGADVSAADKYGYMALSLAASSGHEAVVRLLLENGADVSVATTYGRTALSQAAFSGHKAVVRLLLENGADVSVADKCGRTVLSLAAYSGHEAVVQLLLENGADISVADKDGDTAVSWAEAKGHRAAAQLCAVMLMRQTVKAMRNEEEDKVTRKLAIRIHELRYDGTESKSTEARMEKRRDSSVS